MFKVGHYYKLVHKDSGYKNPVSLVVKIINVVDSNIESEIRIEIIGISDNTRFPKGRKTMFYCNWCFDIKELNDSEVLAYAL